MMACNEPRFDRSRELYRCLDIVLGLTPIRWASRPSLSPFSQPRAFRYRTRLRRVKRNFSRQRFKPSSHSSCSARSSFVHTLYFTLSHCAFDTMISRRPLHPVFLLRPTHPFAHHFPFPHLELAQYHSRVARWHQAHA